MQCFIVVIDVRVFFFFFWIIDLLGEVLVMEIPHLATTSQIVGTVIQNLVVHHSLRYELKDLFDTSNIVRRKEKVIYLEWFNTGFI